MYLTHSEIRCYGRTGAAKNGTAKSGPAGGARIATCTTCIVTASASALRDLIAEETRCKDGAPVEILLPSWRLRAGVSQEEMQQVSLNTFLYPPIEGVPVEEVTIFIESVSVGGAVYKGGISAFTPGVTVFIAHPLAACSRGVAQHVPRRSERPALRGCLLVGAKSNPRILNAVISIYNTLNHTK